MYINLILAEINLTLEYQAMPFKASTRFLALLDQFATTPLR